ncbi:MAG: class I SAM-dependent methyltransferase [Deltaproteobacteria bacterium]|nr:class I SAM-dependent methyltransferase [Deltaproteobacteria bacterium]
MKRCNTNFSSTIDDFSEQWTHFTSNDGYFASEEILQDHFGDLLQLPEITGTRVCEVGSGNGRFLKILSKYASEVVGIEPSDAINVSQAFTKEIPNVRHLKAAVENLGEMAGNSEHGFLLGEFDYVFCIGVLHHLPHPIEALANMRKILNNKGRLIVWVYGKEGNEAYLRIFRPIRAVTVRLPHRLLLWCSWPLALTARCYGWLCRLIPLPLHSYFRRVLNRCSWKTLVMNVYDQLNPRIANYWSRSEIEALFRAAGFNQLRFFHRHGYSWTVVTETNASRSRS